MLMIPKKKLIVKLKKIYTGTLNFTKFNQTFYNNYGNVLKHHYYSLDAKSFEVLVK